MDIMYEQIGIHSREMETKKSVKWKFEKWDEKFTGGHNRLDNGKG